MSISKVSYKSFFATALIPLLLVMCKSNDESPTLNVMANLTASTIKDHQASTRFLFSIDGGTTWTASPMMSVGKKFKVKVQDDVSGLDIGPENFYAVDWSASSPSPDNAASTTPEFTYGQVNNLLVKVTDLHCDLDISSWAGDWTGDAGTVSVNGTPSFTEVDDLTITVDPANTTNGLLVSNWFGIPTDQIKLTLATSTSAFDQIATVDEQVTPTYGAPTSATGTYDQCRDEIVLDVKWIDGSDVYTWTYHLTRP